MATHRSASRIAGYIYNGDLLCLDCIYSDSVSLFWRAGGRVESLSAETNLNATAKYLGIDREDETSFDSNDFPKVIFAASVTDDECTRCGDRL